jgi:anti-anti-sigma factor
VAGGWASPRPDPSAGKALSARRSRSLEGGRPASGEEVGTPPSPPIFAWRLEEAPGSLSLVLDGELCLLSRRAFEPALRALVRRQPLMLLLDLRGVRFFECSGVGLLVEAARRAREIGLPFGSSRARA